MAKTVPDVCLIFAEALKLHQAGRLSEAERFYRQILQNDPSHADSLHLLGVIAHQIGRNDVSIEFIGKAIAIDGAIASYHCNLGVALTQKGCLAAAAMAFRIALVIAPDYAEAHSNLGATLKDLEQLDAAIDAYDVALQIVPDFAAAHANLADALRQAGHPESAIAACKIALCVEPDLVEALCNLGVALNEWGVTDAAIAAFGAALCVKPDLPEGHHNLGLALLLLGRFQEGWPEFEWRLQRKTLSSPRRCFPQPVWRGDHFAGKTILLYAEQGLGDAIQFCRYVPQVAALGGSVILEVHRPLLDLAKGLPGVDGLVAAGDPLPKFDLQRSLMSLPGLFGTTLDNVPSIVPFALGSARCAHWLNRLRSPNRRIGIYWQGNPKHRNDRNRSAPLSFFAPLARLTGVDLISLQKGFGVDQIDRCSDILSVSCLGADYDRGDFSETAAVLTALDLVITIDSAVAHLAGTLGVPVWVALPFIPDWRWLLDRDDTPWYPTMRLFRQKRRGDWQELFDRMALELHALLVDGPNARERAE